MAHQVQDSKISSSTRSFKCLICGHLFGREKNLVEHVEENYCVLEFRLRWRDDTPDILKRCETCHAHGTGSENEKN